MRNKKARTKERGEGNRLQLCEARKKGNKEGRRKERDSKKVNRH